MNVVIDAQAAGLGLSARGSIPSSILFLVHVRSDLYDIKPEKLGSTQVNY